MSHPALTPEALGRLRSIGEGADEPVVAEPAEDPGASSAPGWRRAAGRAKALARRAATPVVGRVRAELARAAGEDHDEVRAELAELRAELARVRSEHAAELAVLHEQLADRDRPRP